LKMWRHYALKFYSQNPTWNVKCSFLHILRPRMKETTVGVKLLGPVGHGRCHSIPGNS
jgi:hypothetical protein